MFLGFLAFVLILSTIFFTLFFLAGLIPYWIFLVLMEKYNPGYFEAKEKN
jgi:hypothetical protein